MDTFLDQVAGQLHGRFGDRISDCCLVVPTRRAAVFMRAALARAYRKTIWAPDILAIQDFIRQCSGSQFPEQLPLLLLLHACSQQQTGKAEPFERFYPWGEMLLRDFDEIDKYCVPAAELYRNVRELKEVDAFFARSGESADSEAVRRFWETLRGRAGGEHALKTRFLQIWETLYEVYAGFRSTLEAQGQAYDGMAYRQLADRLEDGRTRLPWAHIALIGFNALSTAEERIFEQLLARQQATVFWDVDRAYFTPPGESGRTTAHLAGEEPGKFIRSYHSKRWAPKGYDSRLIMHDLAAAPKSLYLTGAPLLTGQAQYAGSLLAGLRHPQERAAVVLADEQMLFPLLDALPDEIGAVNVTMGFPLRQTHAFHLVMSFLRLLRNLRPGPGGPECLYRDVLDLAGNPYLRAHHPEAADRIRQAVVGGNLVFVGRRVLEPLAATPLLRQLLLPPPVDLAQPDLRQLAAHCQALFGLLLQDAASQAEAGLETEFAFHLYTAFSQLQDTLLRHAPAISLLSFTQLVREAIQRVKMPFEGEPLVGVQVMGFLETRLLDFDTVIIAGANEGNLPDTSSGNSFIPYHLRKGFGLPTFEEKDAIYAYHFYRLLQRASTVHLIYNTVVSERGGAREVSRFIEQIRHFFRGHSQIRIIEQTVTPPAPAVGRSAVRAPQQAGVRRILLDRFSGPDPSRFFSASALNSYLRCPLQFYFQYVARIREQEEVEAVIAPNTLGTIVHYTMEACYMPYLGAVLRPADFDAIIGRLDTLLGEAFARANRQADTLAAGRNLLLSNVIRRICIQLLRNDAQLCTKEPFSVEAVESRAWTRTLEAAGQTFRIGGAVDRIDRIAGSGMIRIIDYKTGRVSLSEQQELDADTSFDKQQKEVLQGLLYAWLHQAQAPGQPVQVGYYVARELRKGIQYLSPDGSLGGQALERFEVRLREILERIWSEDFTQVADPAACAVCAYNRICNRA
ncbi:MAG: PD-(D/E)XK nuclease family protein [Bacteroidia bacterium]|nr:PD-(D/E)XK nuclease family protein [Bacteroidia bacterium]